MPENGFEQTKSAHSSELVYSMGDNDASGVSLKAKSGINTYTDEKYQNQTPSEVSSVLIPPGVD